jgi:glycyl-tRNA synthetase beta chain
MIDAATQQLWSRTLELLRQHRLTPEIEAGVYGTHHSTPRRLAVWFPNIRNTQEDSDERVVGPSMSVAYKSGQPTAAAQAFAKKVGLDVSRLEKISTPKGEYLSAKITRKGHSAADLLSELLPAEINSISWPKHMYWRRPEELFVRPVRWLVAMLDTEVIPLEFDGIRAGKESRGHRLLANRPVPVSASGDDYITELRKAKVLGREAREKQIRKSLDAATRTISGARWREDKNLLDTVVNLTEWPSVILGNFDPEFLELPEEVLVTVMRDHQKYFAVEGSQGKLLPHFLAVLNTDGDPQSIIQHGHERVLRARFNDARFFWQTDQKHPLRARITWLRNVTFQKDLGSYYDKTMRVQRLCSWLCELIRQSGMPIRPGIVHKAACLAKTDLTTELVKEFTELQGIVGGLYARVQELDRDMPEATRQSIGQAIYDQYKPESMDDSVPQTIEGAVLAIADKADTIAGMFALGLQPTGSKDPFALRRQANGIVKIIAEHKLPLKLSQISTDARQIYRGSAAEKKFAAQIDYQQAVRTFFRERVEFYFRDALGFKYDVVNAVLAAGDDDVVDALARAKAVAKVRSSGDFESISIAFKRMKNILRQAAETGKQVGITIDPELFQDSAERELASQIPQTSKKVEELRARGDYEAALLEISKLRPRVDRFFDKVMVMVEDARVRANRLALLQRLLKEFSTIADFSEIVTEGKS